MNNLPPGEYAVRLVNLTVTEEHAHLVFRLLSPPPGYPLQVFTVDVPILTPVIPVEVSEARERAIAYLSVAYPVEEVPVPTLAEFADAMEGGEHGIAVWRNVFWDDEADPPDINRWAIANSFEQWLERAHRNTDGGRQ